MIRDLIHKLLPEKYLSSWLILLIDTCVSVFATFVTERMIELGGFHTGQQIKIEYTGLRPGEKLYEEVLADCENTKPTPHEKIRIAQIRGYNYREAREAIDELETIAQQTKIAETAQLMKKIVPEFQSNNSRFEKFDKKE